VKKLGSTIPNLKLLDWLVQNQSVSYSEEMEAFITLLHNYCLEKNYTVVQDHIGNLYVTKGKADSYACIVAHTDTNQDIQESVQLVQIEDILIGWNNVTSEQVGPGFDDKLGILIALQCLEYFSTLKVFFPALEEVGYKGTSVADMRFFDDVNFCIQPDRNSYNNDIITFTNGIETAGKDFINTIQELGLLDEYSYKEANGVGTDIGELKHKGLKCAAVNISCGYYNEHTDQEVCSVSRLHNALNFIIDIIVQIGHCKFEHIPVKKAVVPVNRYWGDYYDEPKKTEWYHFSAFNGVWEKVINEDDLVYLEYEHCTECGHPLIDTKDDNYGVRYECRNCDSSFFSVTKHENKSNKTNKGGNTVSGLW
jgi:hypothetical protein